MAEHRSSTVGVRAWGLVLLTVFGLSFATWVAIKQGYPPDVSGIVALTVGVFAIVLIYSWVRSAKEREDTAALALAKSKKLDTPATLHPVIDPDICIGSLSCLKVCPEGDILGIVDGKAALLNGSACIGHGKCYLECPVDAIKLVFGTSIRGIDLPEVNEYFESSRKGVHIIGELGGMGLIKNAMTQGLQLAEHLASDKSRGKGDAVDLAIVGAGPAGVGAALGCQSKGLSFKVLEQDSLGGTVFSYPRQKIVMTEKVNLPGVGGVGARVLSKEELLAQFTTAMKKAGVSVDQGVKVTGIEGEDGNFTVKTSKGPVKAKKVALAIGRRGTPRKIGCKGEDQEKVTYRLIDPEQYEGSKVLVVGGGDSALEAAIQLVEQSDAVVTLSYRNPEFGKAREANKKKVSDHAAGGRLKLMLPSNVTEIRKDEVDLESNGEKTTLPNDFVIVCIGGELPTEFLGSLGIGMRRHYATRPGEEVVTSPGVDRGAARDQSFRNNQRRLALTLFSIGALIIGVLIAVGVDYYRLPITARLGSPLHAMLKPSGPWGHGVGIISTAFMLSNFLLVLRKRWRRMKGTGHIRNWLTFHQFVGFMSPLVISFHAAFQSNNVLATATAAGLGVVVGTGIIGRFVFGLVTDSDGRTRELAEVTGRWERYKSRLDRMVRGKPHAELAHALVSRACAPVHGGSLFKHLFSWPLESITARTQLRQVRSIFGEKADYDDFAQAFLRALALRLNVGFYVKLKRFMRVWRVWHVSVAVALVFLIAGHIGVSLYLGFRWIL